uniref:Uncharacterized protein n=1 Tax=Rhizophora mucronata TaxID=61149 RepID=A0A2P2PDT9_RHIMU
MTFCMLQGGLHLTYT